MKTLLALLALFTLPLTADRELTAIWEKHPEKVTIIILADGKEIARKATSPEDAGAESEVPIVIKTEGSARITCVAENALGERSLESEPFILPALPKTPKGFKIVINATITVSPTP